MSHDSLLFQRIRDIAAHDPPGEAFHNPDQGQEKMFDAGVVVFQLRHPFLSLIQSIPEVGPVLAILINLVQSGCFRAVLK